MSAPVFVRLALPSDLSVVADQLFALWPDGSLSEHMTEAAAILTGKPRSTMPLVVFVAEALGKVVGLVEVGLRSHADGCDARKPVAFIEGWFVEPEHRRSGVGRALLRAAEEWALAQGCDEMASDTWMDNETSHRAHTALGFEVVDKCVNYKKALR